jgi:hypothetical protein
LGKVVKLESKRIAPPPFSRAQSGGCRLRAASPLTPELKDFIDRAIVPALVEKYLGEMDVAKAGSPVALSKRSMATTRKVRL